MSEYRLVSRFNSCSEDRNTNCSRGRAWSRCSGTSRYRYVRWYTDAAQVGEYSIARTDRIAGAVKTQVLAVLAGWSLQLGQRYGLLSLVRAGDTGLSSSTDMAAVAAKFAAVGVSA